MPTSKQKYPSNSITSRGTKPKKVTKKISGTIQRRKKPFLARIFSENMPSVGDYIMWDVIIPAAKNTITEIISNGIEMLLYGETDRSPYLKRDRGRTHVSYNSIYDSRKRTRTVPERARTRHSFDDIVLDSRADGEEVLAGMLELLDIYEVVSVADFYAMVGLDAEWTDNRYGWDNLASAEVRRIRQGYILDLPKPLPLD